MLGKKASTFSPIVKVVLLIAAFLIIVYFIFQLRDTAKTSASDAVCAVSIQEHIAFTEANLYVEGKIKQKAGILSLFIDPDMDIPAIKCDTKLIKSDARTSEEAEKKLLTQAVKTWNLFNKGKSLIYKDIENKNACFISHVFEFSNELDLSLQYRASITKVNELVAYAGSEETVLEYISLMPLTNLLDYTIIPEAKDANEAIDDLLETVETVKSEDMTDEEFFESEYNQKIQTLNYQLANSLTTSTIQDKTGIKKINTFCINYNSFSPLPKTTKDNIVIVFLQCHEDDKFRSTLYMVPYNEQVLNLIGCDELPIKFED